MRRTVNGKISIYNGNVINGYFSKNLSLNKAMLMQNRFMLKLKLILEECDNTCLNCADVIKLL